MTTTPATTTARANATIQAAMPGRIASHSTKDKYGRSCLYAYAAGELKVHAVMCTLPKAARERNPAQAYLVNDWSLSDRSEAVRYFSARSAALTYLKSLVGA